MMQVTLEWPVESSACAFVIQIVLSFLPCFLFVETGMKRDEEFSPSAPFLCPPHHK